MSNRTQFTRMTRIEKGTAPRRGATDTRKLSRTDFATEEDEILGETGGGPSEDPSEALLGTSANEGAATAEARETAIREAAYRRFEARGGRPGSEVDDWLQAQAEVDSRPA